MTHLNKPFNLIGGMRPTGLKIHGNGNIAAAVPEVERIFDLDKYETSLQLEAYFDRKQLKQAESVMIDLVQVLKWMVFLGNGSEPLTVINQMLTLTAILGNSCNAVGQRMGELILMNVFSNLKEWIDRTAEACEQAKRLKEEKLRKQKRMGRGTRRVMRLSSFVAARSAKIEAEEILPLKNWLQTGSGNVC